jgi:hypothetical protein
VCCVVDFFSVVCVCVCCVVDFCVVEERREEDGFFLVLINDLLQDK